MDYGPPNASHKEDIKQRVGRIICALVSKGLGNKNCATIKH